MMRHKTKTEFVSGRIRIELQGGFPCNNEYTFFFIHRAVLSALRIPLLLSSSPAPFPVIPVPFPITSLSSSPGTRRDLASFVVPWIVIARQLRAPRRVEERVGLALAPATAPGLADVVADPLV